MHNTLYKPVNFVGYPTQEFRFANSSGGWHAIPCREASPDVQFLDFNVEELRARLRKTTHSIPTMQRAGRRAVGTFSLLIST